MFGSSLAALVAVYELSKFEQVRWVRQSETIGGHFSGIKIEEMRFDLGMVINEPYSSPIRFKDANQRLPSKLERVSYVHMIFEWLSSVGLEFDPIPVFTFFRNKVYSDFLIADNLELLTVLSQDEQIQIRRELVEINNSIGIFHPRNKHLSDFYISASYSEALRISTSSLLSDLLIFPWINKMKKGIGDLIPAIEHRSIWAPLYYPETLLAVLDGDREPEFLERPFSVPRNQSINQLLQNLKEDIASRKSVTSIVSKDSMALTQIESSSKIYFYGTSSEYSQFSRKPSLTKDFDRREILLMVGVLETSSDLNQVVNFVDSDILSYRLTLRAVQVSSQMVQNFTLEFGESACNLDDATLINELENVLYRLNIVALIKSKKFIRTTIPIFSKEIMLKNLHEIALQNDELNQNNWRGSIVDFGTQAFNDQCLIGLWDLNAR